MMDERFRSVGSDPSFKKRKKGRKVKVDPRFGEDARSSKGFETEATARVEPPAAEMPSAEIDAGLEADASSSSSSESELEVEAEAWDAALPATHSEERAATESTRLAVTDCDWEHVRAKDIVAILESLCGGGGVVRVSVYKSRFGASEEAYEARRGPRLRGEGPEAVRRYELSKLRRYFAVAEFASREAAAAAYANDGLEVEATSAPLALAYVDDSQSFAEFSLRDTATQLDEGYRPPHYYVAARQQTAVTCAWEAEDDAERVRAFAAGGDDDLAEYVAPPEDDDDAEAIRRSLLLDDDPHTEERRDEFFCAASCALREPSSGGDGDDEATRAGGPRKEKKKKVGGGAKRAACVDDDDDDEEGYDARELSKAERLKAKKLRGKRKRDRQTLVAKLDKSRFALDTRDARFKSVFDNNPDFGIDPTAPAFKKTANMRHILAAQAAKR